MPITVTPTLPGPRMGPGLPIQWSSSVDQSGMSTPTWEASISTNGDFTLADIFDQQVFLTHHLPTGSWTPLVTFGDAGSFRGVTIPQQGANSYLRVRLVDGFAFDTSGTITLPWDGITGLPVLIQQNAGGTGGSLNAEQSAQLQAASDNSATALANWDTYTSVTLPSLQDVLNGITGAVSATITGAEGVLSTTVGAIMSGKLLDLLTTFDAGGGTTCDPIDADLSGGMFYGVIVHCDTVPDFYAFTSPGDSWCPRDLAVLTISRGGAILLRQGIHTRSHMVYPLPGVPAITMEIDVPFEPPAYNVKVDWGEGVCGRLLAMELP